MKMAATEGRDIKSGLVVFFTVVKLTDPDRGRDHGFCGAGCCHAVNKRSRSIPAGRTARAVLISIMRDEPPSFRQL